MKKKREKTSMMRGRKKGGPSPLPAHCLGIRHHQTRKHSQTADAVTREVRDTLLIVLTFNSHGSC
jgi:hypothetical protein